jgi:hypothetical protein
MGGHDNANQKFCDRTQLFSWLGIVSDGTVLEIFEEAGGRVVYIFSYTKRKQKSLMEFVVCPYILSTFSYISLSCEVGFILDLQGQM